MTQCSECGEAAFLAGGKSGWLALVRPGLAFAASCSADPRLDLVGLYQSLWTYPAAEFRQHFEAHRRRGWMGPCGTQKLPWDIDGDDATADARKLASYLIDRYSIDEDSVLIGLTGLKGYHIEIPFQIPPDDIVPAAVGRLCRSVADAIGIGTFDAGNYDRVRLWRCWNSRHERTGLYKRRIRIDELIYLGRDRHAELAGGPLAFEPPGPVRSPSLDADWIRARAEEAKARATRPKPAASGEGASAGGLTDLAWAFISGGKAHPGRNKACVHAAACLARAGCPEALAFDLLSRAAEACEMVADYSRGDVLRAIANGWRLGREEASRPAAEGDGDEEID